MKDSKTQALIQEIRLLEKEINLLNTRVEKLENELNLTTRKSSTTYDENVIFNIPACCKNCSNHPSNGGSGICHCTLPYFENPTKWGITCDISYTPDITYNAMDNTYTINDSVAEYGQLCYAEDTNADTIAKTSTTYHASAKTQL